MASKKCGGSSRNGRTSNPQYRCVKIFGGEQILTGNIIVTQCGNKFYAGENVGTGNNFTLFAKTDGKVVFYRGFRRRSFVKIIQNV